MKRVAMGLAFAMAVSAFASQHPQTINRVGLVGVNKTQSGQSLGHSKLVFKTLGEVNFGNDQFPDDNGRMAIDYNGRYSSVGDYTGMSLYMGLAAGFSNYFDIGFTLPFYYDQFTAKGEPISHTKEGYIGNVGVDVKARLPLPDDQPFDIAVFGGITFNSANEEKQGLWVREPEYINKVTGVASPFGAPSMVAKGGLAITADLGKIDAAPLLIHLNGGYRYSLESEYQSFAFTSVAAEIYFTDFISLFAEGFYDIQLDKFKWNLREDGTAIEENMNMMQLSGAFVFHTPVGLDIQIGGSYYLGGDNYEVHNVKVFKDADRKDGFNLYKTRVNPNFSIFGGLTWNMFLLPQDRDNDGVVDTEDNCPDDYGHRLNQGCPLGNPDTDEDGVCDAWVSEKGLLGEFTNICSGVDQCPNEKGDSETGCALGDPDVDKDGICDPWVSQQKLSDKFADICKGIDNCPNEPGTEAAKGCPEDNPDPDGDGLCSPWVTDKNKLAQYAGVCKGYDMCPGEAGAAGNKGCPWDDPDSDGDGMCDEWVVQKKMGFYFEKAAEDTAVAREWFIDKTCKGLDKCPLEHGPAVTDGCPLGDPDLDKDGVCDAWVTEKGLLNQFEGVCFGIDKCPTEAGDDGQGCPKKPVEKLDGVVFKSGKATLSGNAKKILKSVAQKLVNDEAYKDLKIVIQGHTDNRGKAKKNLKLSENRAKAVMKMLTKYGVQKDRIKSVGFGSTCPVDDNSTADGREMNRRIEMHFVTVDNDGMKCESNYVGD